MPSNAGSWLARNRVSPGGWLVFAVTGLSVLLGVGVWVVSRPPLYTGSAVVAIVPKGPRPVSAGVVMLTAPRYVAYATSPYALRQVAGPAGRDSAELRDAVVVTMAAATANITVAVTLDDPRAAARTANLLAEAVAKRTAADPILGAQVVSPAVPVPEPAGPGRPALLGAGLLAGLVAGSAAARGFERYQRRRGALTARGVAPVATAIPGDRAASSVGDSTRELPVLTTGR